MRHHIAKSNINGIESLSLLSLYSPGAQVGFDLLHPPCRPHLPTNLERKS